MADYYIAISREIKRVLVSDGIAENRIFVVHSGIDTNRFATSRTESLMGEFGLEEDERIVLNVAHLAGHKGQSYLLRAVPLVLEEIPATRFFVVGGGDLRSELTRLAKDLSVQDKVVFTGFRDDVGGFYKIADLFVMSSLQEGLGTALLDALALGIPVVATAAGGITESVWHGKTGRLVPPGDPDALAKEIVYMLRHPEEAHKMKGFGQALVQKRFSKEAMVRGNVHVYRHILKDQNSIQ
jgi:glycosyltransferase involved in cell wall biosynthesis